MERQVAGEDFENHAEAEANEGLEILYKGEKGAWGNMRFKESVIN
jgi:hypothetical protein